MSDLKALLTTRYAGLEPDLANVYDNPVIDTILRHRTIRRFKPDPLPPDLLEWLIACAQSAPTKSDLQGMSVIVVESPELRQQIGALIPEQPHIVQAPLFVVWCPDMRRNQVVCQLQGREHRSNTLDTFLNVSIDTAICLQNFTLAAESVGLGTCLISAVRIPVFEVSQLLDLPHGVYPLAGTCVGYPAGDTGMTPRLPQRAVVHRDRFNADSLEQSLHDYDCARHAARPFFARSHLHQALYGPTDVDAYGWLENTARRLEQTERANFRDYIEQQGFALR